MFSEFAPDLLELVISDLHGYAVFSISETGLINDWNASAERLFGYSAAEILYQPLAVLHSSQKMEAMRLTLLAGIPAAFPESICIKKNGEVFSASIKVAPLRQHGQRKGFGVFVRKLAQASNVKFEASLQSARLWAETVVKEQQRERDAIIIESEKRYSDLFHLSPQPMWVYQLDNLFILDVNRAAVIHYGYSYDEFLKMNIRDIRPPEDLSQLEEVVQESREMGRNYFHGIFRHKKKSGEVIQVDIQSKNISFNQKAAKLVLATDITEKLRYMDKIEKQNTRLLEISWMQSHVMRAPVARLMGLIGLVTEYENSPEEQKTMLHYILDTAHELDQIIKDISNKAAEL